MQRRFVSIWFPHLVTDWYIRKQPDLKDRAFVIKISFQNRVIVAHASPLGMMQGIRKGMALADAKALCPELLALDYHKGLEEQLLQRFAEWCIRFTPVAAPDPTCGVLLEATGCTHLWGSEEAYLTDLVKRIKNNGYTVRVAIADTIGVAWAAARYRKSSCIIHTGKQREALLSLPSAALRLDPAVIERLNKLGLRQIKDFIAMPPTALRRRFGKGILQRIQQALGEAEETITPVYPIEPYQERLPTLEPIITLTGIEIALQQLIKALCQRLRKEGKGLRTAYFRTYRIDGGTQGLEIGTSRATSNEEHLFQLFRLRLGDIAPEPGIELFILEATKVEDSFAVQESLWAGASSLDNRQVAELLDRISNKLGKDKVQRYLPAEHYWPERSFKKATALDEISSGTWRVEKLRPLSLLIPPEAIDVTAPVPDYPPMSFRYKGRLHKVIKADGPERIEQEWWVEEGKHRDYYAVEDEEGQRYWLFRSGHYTAERTERWYLHGFFP